MPVTKNDEPLGFIDQMSARWAGKKAFSLLVGLGTIVTLWWKDDRVDPNNVGWWVAIIVFGYCFGQGLADMHDPDPAKTTSVKRTPEAPKAPE